MDLNKDLLTKILSIVSLVVLGYIFFISVYNQIIVQSGGLFFVVIFGGILILAFVLLSLVTKLIEITKEIKDNFMWNFVEILLLCNFAYLFFAFRLSYQTTVPAEETIIYRAAALMRTGELGAKGMDMFADLIAFPADYVYAFILSLFLRVSDGGSSAMLTMNAIVLILTAFVMDRVVRRMAGRACGVIAALCTLFIPSQSFAVYSYSSEFFFCLILLLCIDLFFIALKCEDNKMLIYCALLGAATALLCFTEPLMIICVIFFAVFFILKKKSSGSDPIRPVAVISAVAVIFFILLIFVKSLSLNTDIGNIISGSMSRFALTKDLATDEKYSISDVFAHFHSNLDNKNSNVTDNYHFLINKEGEAYTQTHNAWFSLGTQMSYMFVIVMSIACAFYMFKSRVKDAVPGFILLVSCFLLLLFRSTDEASTYFMFEVLIILASCGLNYMYLNHHPELRIVSESAADSIANSVADKDVSEWGTISRARSLIFAGKNQDQILYDNSAQTNAVMNTSTVNPANTSAQTGVSGSEQTEGIVSPEGYFSFFSLGGQSSSSVVSAKAVNAAPEQTEQYIDEQPVTEEQVYEETVSEYAEPSEEYAEPVYEEPLYEEAVSEYTEPSEEYAEPLYEEPVYEEAVSEYAEPSEEYAEPVYEEPVYEEAVSEYAEPSEEYAEPVYEEPVYEEAVSEYAEPSGEYVEPVYEEHIAENNKVSGNGGVKSSYGNAAHALGFSFGEDLFADLAGTSEYEEPESEYEEYSGEPIVQDSVSQQGTVEEAGLSETEFDIFGNEVPYEEELQPMPADDAHKPYYASEDQEIITPTVPAYEFGGNYDSDVDEFSFGESMPDIFDNGIPSSEQKVEETTKKKKVIRKVVKRVVKKAPDKINIQADFRQDEALNNLINDMNFDEADSRLKIDENNQSSDYVIEI